MRLLVISVVLNAIICDAQFIFKKNLTNASPLPFPPCRIDDIDCLRRGIRSFFFMMDSGSFGMKPVDPIEVNSVAVAMPEDGLRFLIRNINATGTRWTRLSEKFNLEADTSGVLFTSDLHITGEITMETVTRTEPYFAFITIDVQDFESNITYSWSGEKGVDNEYYILIGLPRIAVRNMRTPSFFLQPAIEEKAGTIIEQVLQLRMSALDLLTNEIETSVMHAVVDNFRLFASKIPIKYYYQFPQ